MQKKKAPKRYCIFQVQNGLWYQVGYFAVKERAKNVAEKISGKVKVSLTYPSAHNYPVK